MLLYLGRDPNSESLDDLQAAEQVLMSIRPYVRYINSSKYIEDLANGEICLALGWSGDVGQARSRAGDAGNGVKIRYNIATRGRPSCSSTCWLFRPMRRIRRNAHLFIDYLLRPDVAAKNSSSMHLHHANAAAYSLVDPAVFNDRGVYPSEAQKAHLYPERCPQPGIYARAQPHLDAFQDRSLTRAAGSNDIHARVICSSSTSASASAISLRSTTSR